MESNEASNASTPSTTWAWRKVKIGQPPQANVERERSEASSLSLLPWPRSKPVTVVLKYRGGPECWVEVRARGRLWRRSGDTALYDVLCTVFGWQPK